MGKLMKLIPFLLFTVVCCGASIHDQFVSALEDADLIVIEWRDYPEVSALGIRREKVRYEGADRIRFFLSHVQFEADLPPREPVLSLVESTPDGVISIPRTRHCRCEGSHLIRAYRGKRLITEFSYHHSRHLRSTLVDGGRDVDFTEVSREWLKAEIDWNHDFSLIENAQEEDLLKSTPSAISGSVEDGGGD